MSEWGLTNLPREMDETHLERRFRNEIDQLQRRFELRLQVLERQALGPANYIASPNYLINSHPEWSTDAWQNVGTLPSDPGDPNRECYRWQYHTKATTNLSASSALIGSGHSGYAGLNADAPVWDFENGRILMGGTTALYDLSSQLTTDFIFPGQRYFVYFEAIATDPDVDLGDAEMYCGFWDDTSTVEDWISGSPFTPTTSIFGPTGTRTLKYRVLVSTDGGDQILSNEVTVSNAPTTMSAENHVRLFFTGAPGFIRFEVYRYDGLSYRKVGDINNSIDLQFFDTQENAGTLEPAYPTLTANAPQAIRTTTSLAVNATSYTPHTMVVQVPTTYDRTTTGNLEQWFRMGLTQTINKARGIAVRRVMVSEGFGPWTRSAKDLSDPLSGPTTTAASSPVSGTTGNVIPTGGVDCVTLDTLIDVIQSVNGVDVVHAIPARDVTVDHYVVCGGIALPVLQIKDGAVQEIYLIETASGKRLRCSATHRIIQSAFDRHGKAAQFLEVGDFVLTVGPQGLEQDKICSISLEAGHTPVRSFSLPAPHLFVTDEIVSHNDKSSPIDTIYREFIPA